ncbi:MAG: histidine--tRNA ligase [Desulfovibrio sp.]|uniref:histidine--tRNA ligase n=1 Tax=Desulfovibrio sp. 7SRBS1 TaxID=3378064 RepID=UPI003B407BE0
MSSAKKIKGFADMFPPDSDRFTFLENTARSVFFKYGFGELRTPILERTEVFAKGIGEDTDVVGKEMYTFPDRKGRSLTMRPEATAGVMRAFIESKQYQPGGVYKLCTMGPMFRYERPQKGRMRQFHQINCEALGSDSPLADAEVILMLNEFLLAAGLDKLTFEVNSLGCNECRPKFRQALTDFFAAIPEEELCDDCKRRRNTNPLRVLDCKVERCKKAIEGVPELPDHICPKCRDHFAEVLEVLDASDISYVRNPRLVRGLDYYQSTTFEVVSGDIGSQSSVAGGGRYDGLVKMLGGPDVPGVGFACGMERLALLLEAKDGELAEQPDFYIAVLDERGLRQGLLLAQQLRAEGLSGECALAAGSMKSQLRRAGKLNVRFALILGGEELDAKTVVVKNLQSGDQATVPMKHATTLLKGSEQE